MFMEVLGIVVITLVIGFVAGAFLIFSLIEFELIKRGYNLMKILRGED